jgi:hypothetical protein
VSVVLLSKFHVRRSFIALTTDLTDFVVCETVIARAAHVVLEII